MRGNGLHIVVTGAAGFSGRHLVTALIDAGHMVTAQIRRADDQIRLPRHPQLRVITGDLSQAVALPDRCDAIVHTAARSPPAPDRAMISDNIVATANLLDYAQRAGASTVIYFSSLSVYGAIHDDTVSEATPMVAPGVYGASKYLGEAMLQNAPSGIRSLSLRLPGIIGPGSARNWLSSVLASAKAGRDIAFYRAGAQFNNAVHIADLCRLVCNCLSRSDWNGHDAVTLGAGGMTTVRQAVTIIADGFGARSALKASDDDRRGFVISSARATHAYGYAPMGIQQMLARFIEENR